MPKSEQKVESEEFQEARSIHQASNSEAVYLGVKIQRMIVRLDRIIELTEKLLEEKQNESH